MHLHFGKNLSNMDPPSNTKKGNVQKNNAQAGLSGALNQDVPPPVVSIEQSEGVEVE